MLSMRVITRLGIHPIYHKGAVTSVSNRSNAITLRSSRFQGPIPAVQSVRNFSFSGLINECRSFSEAFAGTTWSKNMIECKQLSSEIEVLVFIENCDLSYTSSLIVTGFILRIATLPFYYLAEKNNAKRIYGQNIISNRIAEVILNRIDHLKPLLENCASIWIKTKIGHSWRYKRGWCSYEE